MKTLQICILLGSFLLISTSDVEYIKSPESYSFLKDIELLLEDMEMENPHYYYNNTLLTKDATFSNNRQSRRYMSRSRLRGLGEDVLIIIRSLATLVVDPYGNKGNESRQSFFSNGLAGLSEYLMSLVENSLDDLPSLPRLDAQECMKRSICEAHNKPKRYGLMGLVLQLLFPPYTKTDDSNAVVSKYQLAARYGRQGSANCANQYDGCMINVLDIVKAIVKLFIR